MSPRRSPAQTEAETAGRPEGRSVPSTWFDAEPPLRAAAFRTVGRLVGRGRASWKTWVACAALLSGLALLAVARGPRIYDVTVALRVTEGLVETGGAHLSGAALRAHVEDLAFTSRHLVEVMRKHPQSFGRVDQDSSEAVAEMRQSITVAIVESDFIGDRKAENLPRSARIEVTYKAADPKLAWTVAQELAELVIGTTLGGARAAIARARAASAAALSQAEARVEGAMGVESPFAGTGGPRSSDPRVAQATDRLQAVGTEQTEADLSLKAMEEQQALRFEVIDPGRVPVPLPRVTAMAALVIVIASLFGAWLLVGAFDPRVLDADDLAGLGFPVLGGLPPLPTGKTRD